MARIGHQEIDVEDEDGEGAATRLCEMAACTNLGARARSIAYVCDPCWAQVQQRTAELVAEQSELDAYDAHIAAEEADA